ncbi:uncharacterized protein L3040_006552 [Drepanopeziza brunnea f. sp. 'multigermtubi']|uniref:Uncharacterized protein n=1 Tax=Marssonina brunnea f. sp. multigermtubi (strain MB_m1) TaxID=1072389 RepID=K1XDY0_MARBU|nr:uncharacterized protein MBM_02300 [Drepanopeziza brunnea f. sp. 'multigermtubi' MB_m1]EKD19063.1 hypothetical protein MBM_02300 [Drepanopeziza brunnea f. sp. 'multigermtubi' MB_m1]KAJ5038873.1 hypothetical protein L3040_006552 [Drepanopeziza brunnea f. sp. 'multigermtubi']
MILSSQFTCSILLALSFLVNRAYGERGIIGYRTVQEWEAKQMNAYQKPFRDRVFDKDNAQQNQLGHGLYLINEPASWNVPEWLTSWYCVVEADMDKFAETSKIWIPGQYTGLDKHGRKRSKPTQLWNWRADNENTILEYIRVMGQPNPKKALRFARVPAAPGKLQVVIPSDMVNRNTLDFSAQCWETKEELFDYSSATVDWMNWEIAGDPDVADPEPSDSSDKKEEASWYQGWLDCIRGSGTCTW